jgi:hypothetical protein
MDDKILCYRCKYMFSEKKCPCRNCVINNNMKPITPCSYVANGICKVLTDLDKNICVAFKEYQRNPITYMQEG